ncbi:MarR family winged helix-turn-helix transcriptional regulator [Chloroflexota bacterium]
MKNFHEDQVYILWVLLAQTRHAIAKARKKALRKYNMSTTQAGTLFVIHAIGDKATPAKISRWLFREPHSVSELLGRMEKKGLVKKVKDLDKKNQVRIMLTEKGRETYHHQSINPEPLNRIMSSLSDEERRQLRSYLLILWDNTMKELGMEQEMPFPLLGQAVPFEQSDNKR